MSDSPLLDREQIEQAFRLLGDKLAARGVVADIYVFGGAAMVLAMTPDMLARPDSETRYDWAQDGLTISL